MPLADGLEAEKAVEQVHGEREDVVVARRRRLAAAHVQHPGGERVPHPRLHLRLRVLQVVGVHAVVLLEAQQVGQEARVAQQPLVQAAAIRCCCWVCHK